eukprot:UN03167
MYKQQRNQKKAAVAKKQAKKQQKKVAKVAKKPLTTAPKRNISTSAQSQRSFTRNKTNGFKPEATSAVQSVFTPTTSVFSQTPAPHFAPFTQQVAFAPTSKRWNKKRSQSAVNKEKRHWIRQRYHGSNYMDPYPEMTMAKFIRLPRPLFIESETIDLFVPAPQVEHLATPAAYNAAAAAAQQPY